MRIEALVNVATGVFLLIFAVWLPLPVAAGMLCGVSSGTVFSLGMMQLLSPYPPDM